MALQTQFPLFSPPPPTLHRPATEIRFSRWNNGNARKFIRRETAQKDLEDQLRLDKRFDSALAISHNYNPAPPHPTFFKSTGTPSSPSSPSIPGRSSKYSKSPPSRTFHPAFKSLKKPTKIQLPVQETDVGRDGSVVGPSFRIGENGVSYELPEAPFVYQYSYTETPKVKPVKLREPLVSPFGPVTMAKPWLGRKPLPPSKKRVPEFDSFRLPPVNKKGVKPVQRPGPFLPGSGPKYVRSREEVLGEPLTKEEIEELINGCKKSDRQLNIGRDGLTHNMLDNIHAHWKRRRVCKIKCKGVCTVDMDNVCQQLEEKTGGKIIYSRGGVIYLFRGRNYNYRSRPRFPLMLWKPIAPVYPRLIKRVPEGLTLEEASDMRKRGRDLTPICKLAKNGVYCDLVRNVREAFEACKLVRINCQGLNTSDYKKIGAKLKDLVPCVLLSFECEHILIWRGQDWKSSLEPNEPKWLPEFKADFVASELSASSPTVPSLHAIETKSNDLEESSSPTSSNEKLRRDIESIKVEAENNIRHQVPDNHLVEEYVDDSEKSPVSPSGNQLETFNQNVGSETVHMDVNMPWTEGVLLLRKQAVESGMAFLLDGESLDADTVFKRAVAFAKTAPKGPVFGLRRKQLDVERKKEKDKNDLVGPKEAQVVSETQITVTGRRDERKASSRAGKMEDIKADYLNVVPRGKLGVDELAKLLA